jgi:predicted esterase
MRKIFLLQTMFLVLTISCFGQIDRTQLYEELETKAISYFRNNHTDSSIITMEYAYENFPEEFARTSNLLAYIYTRTNNLSKAIDIWSIGIEKGYVYDLNNPYYQNYYKDNAVFERLAQMEKSKMDSMHLQYEIVLPTGYNNEKIYPILFVFHGNNRNIAKAKLSWKAPIMNQEFITVFLQSYIPSSPTDFKWVPDDEKIKKEFTEIYDQILKNYPVDDSKIIFAGMSAGGKKALDFTLHNYFPVSGLVLNCPVVPENVTDSMITNFAETDKKLGILTGGNDFALEGQQKLVSTIDSLGGQTRIFVTEDLGHSFAENFTQLLDEYLRWVIETE